MPGCEMLPHTEQPSITWFQEQRETQWKTQPKGIPLPLSVFYNKNYFMSIKNPRPVR